MTHQSNYGNDDDNNNADDILLAPECVHEGIHKTINLLQYDRDDKRTQQY
jgi:hypothetical protein